MKEQKQIILVRAENIGLNIKLQTFCFLTNMGKKKAVIKRVKKNTTPFSAEKLHFSTYKCQIMHARESIQAVLWRRIEILEE